MSKMKNAEELLKAWDEMENAAQRVTTSLPGQLSESVARLEKARLAARDVVHRIATALMQESK